MRKATRQNKQNMRSKRGKLKSIIFIVLLSVFMHMTISSPLLKAADPEVEITNYYTSSQGPVEKDESLTLTVLLKNNTDPSLELLDGAKATVKDCSFYVPDSNAQIQDITWTTGALTGSVTFTLKYDGGSRTTIPLQVTDRDGKILSVGGKSIKIKTASASPSVPDTPDDTSKYVPILNIMNSTMPSGSAGSSIGISLSIKNTGSYTARNIRITPDLSDDSPFTLDGSNAVQTINDLSPNKARTIRYYFMISPSAQEKVYQIKFDFKYYNDYDDYFGGSNSPLSESIYIKVINTNTSPRLSIGDVQFQYTDQEPSKKIMDTKLKIVNLGNLTAKDVKITLQGLKDDGLGLYKDTNLKSVESIDGNSETLIHYALLPSNKIGKGNYGLTARIEYKDQGGQEYSGEHQFFVPVEYGEGGNSVPKIILNEYYCNPSIVKAGENFTLNLSFLNTSKDKAISNIKIFFTVPENESNTSGSVFTPVKSSNTFFIDYIPPKGVYRKTLEFFTIPDATPKTYTLTANFEYEEENGTEHKATELIGVPVNQQIKLETSDIQFPPEAYLGQPLPASMDFYNMGKAKLSNLMIKLEGDFDIQNGNYFVGNFEIGASDFYEGTIIPNTPGMQEGAIIISYDEPSGEHLEIRKDFTLNVIEMPMPEMPPGFEPEGLGPQNGLSKTILWVGLAVLITAIIGFITYKKGLFKKLINKKKGYTLDE